MNYCTICLSNRRKMFTHTCGETCCHACATAYVHYTCGTATGYDAPDKVNDATNHSTSDDAVARCMFCREELDYMEIAELMPVNKYVQLRAQNVADGFTNMFTNVYPDLVRAYRQKTMDLHHFPEFVAANRRLNEAFVTSMTAITNNVDHVTQSLRQDFEDHRSVYDRLAASVGFNKYPGPIEAVGNGTLGMARPQLCTCSGVLDFTLENPLCSACGKIMCMTCREPVAADEYATHVCDRNAIESVKEIETVCKQCPLCKAYIQKADGCNDMFCTVCHTSFNWRTLEISKHETHNPHRAAYLDETRRAYITANDLCGRDIITHMDLQAVRAQIPADDMRLLASIRALATSIESYLIRKHPFAIKTNADRYRERLRYMYASEQINETKFGRQLHLHAIKIQADITAFTQYFFLRDVLEHLLLSYFEDVNRDIKAIQTGCREVLDWFKTNCAKKGVKPANLLHLFQLMALLAPPSTHSTHPPVLLALPVNT
jgi:hypothetical protein